MTKTKSKTTRPEMTDEQLKLCSELAGQILKCFRSFQLEDLITMGRRKSLSLNREVMTAWGNRWIGEAKQRGFIKEVNGLYDAPVYEVLNYR